MRDRYPHEVSGGQAQRAAIGRALAPQPALLLFDEPFNNLDPVLKWEMLQELRTVLSETAATALFVTHDRDEAFTVADTIALLHRGRIAQVGDAEALYTAPASAFVARYLGAVNLVPVWRQGAAWVSALGEFAGAAPFRHAGVDAVSVRPWQLGIDSVTGNGAAGRVRYDPGCSVHGGVSRDSGPDGRCLRLARPHGSRTGDASCPRWLPRPGYAHAGRGQRSLTIAGAAPSDAGQPSSTAASSVGRFISRSSIMNSPISESPTICSWSTISLVLRSSPTCSVTNQSSRIRVA